ncbi:hypothetical protein [Acetobacterium tundrae]|uniref:SGNH hydrolase-type esterase domain-containing protein n=1 Tax=Acetobacterium tundrae TaxID=132932 RepID=A0ABR6WM70_9FIRM|nr:hypothetical protein [Acetobacterium tundrae]MBC3797527.1 hypothetical protein [Acetobacterium tundrae]
MKIVCFGDSLTFGYNVAHKDKWHVLAEKKTGIRMQNSEINGDTTDGMRFYLRVSVT